MHLFVYIISILLGSVLASSKPQVHVLSLFPGGWRSGLDIAAQMAAKDINDANDILTDYEFVLHINNTNPDDPGLDNKATAVRFLYHHVYEGPAIPILVGTYFSSESEILCESNALWDIIQISYGAVSPRLSSRTRCPTFYRTIYSSVQQNLLRVKLLRHFGWDRVAIVAQNDLLFTAVSDNLRRLLEADNVTVVASELFLNDASGTMRYIKEKDARIIIGLFYEPQARMALCEAYKQGIYGGRYAWIIRSIGFENPDFLFDSDSAITCTGAELAKATEGAITTTWKLTTDSVATMPTGKTAQEYYAEYTEVSGPLYFSLHTLVYDAVLAAALALNGSLRHLQTVNKTLDNFKFGDEEVRRIIAKNLDDMFFNGASGPVGFADDGDRLGVFNIQQFNQSGFIQTVGYYHSYDERFFWDAPHKLTWANGAPPHDEIKKKVMPLTMSPAILVLVFCLSVLGITLALGLLAFNILKRNERAIKMSSPNINNIIIIGGVVSYLAVIMAGVDSSIVGANAMDHVCRARLWLLSLGFTLAFGSMFSKTFRVHRIFLNKKLEKRVVKDYQLLGMSLTFVAMEIIYLLIWELMYPLHALTETLPSQATVNEDLMIIPSLESCYRSEFSSISWLVGIYVFNGILLLFGLFLAFETRHVHIKELNDSKNIGISVYNVTILSTVGAIFSLLMDPLHYQLVYIITSTCILLSITSTLVIIFAPKVLQVQGFTTVIGIHLAADSTRASGSSLHIPRSRVEPANCGIDWLVHAVDGSSMADRQEDYTKLMDDLERQDRLLLMVTDRLVDTIEELKLAYAAKDGAAATCNDTTSTSTTSTASTPTTCCNCTKRVGETTPDSGLDDVDSRSTMQTYSITRTVTPVTLAAMPQSYEVKHLKSVTPVTLASMPQSFGAKTITPVTVASVPRSYEVKSNSPNTARNGVMNLQSTVTPVTLASVPQSFEVGLQYKSQSTGQRSGLVRPHSLTTEKRTKQYLETDIDAVPYQSSSKANCQQKQQEWTVTLTDGMGKSRPAKSVNQRFEK